MEYAYRLIGLTLYYILLAKSLSCLDRQITKMVDALIFYNIDDSHIL